MNQGLCDYCHMYGFHTPDCSTLVTNSERRARREDAQAAALAQSQARVAALEAALRELVGSLDAIEEAAGTRYHEAVGARYDAALQAARAALGSLDERRGE